MNSLQFFSKYLPQMLRLRKARTNKASFRLTDRNNIILLISICLTVVFVLATSQIACALDFRLSGRIDAEILVENPVGNRPSGKCVIPFSVTRDEDSWHMQFRMPAAYMGNETVLDYYYGSKERETYSVIEMKQPSAPNGRQVFYTAGVSTSGDPLMSYSSCAPIFLVWVSYLRGWDVVETIPRLFYDHRANFIASSSQCRGVIQSRNGIDAVQVEFKEVSHDRDESKSNSWAFYKVLETTNVNGMAIIKTFKFDTYVRTPVVIDGKLILKDGWAEARKEESGKVGGSIVPGARYCATVDELVISDQFIEFPPPLKADATYQIVDKRFGGSDMSSAAIYNTNRWLTREEASPNHHARQLSLISQEIPRDSGNALVRNTKVRTIMLASLGLSVVVIFYLIFSGRWQQNNKTTKK